MNGPSAPGDFSSLLTANGDCKLAGSDKAGCGYTLAVVFKPNKISGDFFN